MTEIGLAIDMVIFTSLFTEERKSMNILIISV
jgi:hypothetical protein